MEPVAAFLLGAVLPATLGYSAWLFHRRDAAARRTRANLDRMIAQARAGVR